MSETPQTYENHRQNRPLYLSLYVIFFADVVWTTWHAIQAPSFATVLAVVTAVALLLLTFYARVFALVVQDRLIRLEMRLKLRELLPAALHSRIHEFSKGQLVALRFASDAELPTLAETVLRDKIKDQKAIKQMIKNWQGDFLRA